MASRTFRHPTFVLVAFASGLVFVAVAALWWATRVQQDDPKFAEILQTAASNLIIVGFLVPAAKLIFGQVDRARAKRDSTAQFIGNLLNDLKSVFDRVERARVLIPAHRSVLTYGKELRDLIEVRVKLLNVLRALSSDSSLGCATAVRSCVERMESYLQSLLGEFKDNYKGLSETQRRDEARVKAEMPDASTKQSKVEGGSEPWLRLAELPRLSDLLARTSLEESRSGYEAEFIGPLDAASKHLRQALAELLD